MKVKGLIAVAAVLLATANVCASRPVPTASVDRVPREDWSYDAMIHLAGRGLVPGETSQRFEGNWAYDREEMARFVKQAIETATDATPESDRAILGKLALDYRAELLMLGAGAAYEKALPWAAIKTWTPAGFVAPTLELSGGDLGAFADYRATGLVSPSKYSWGDATFSNVRRRADGDAFSIFDKYFVRGKTEHWEWEVGQDYLWWSPGYSGSMILSDNSPGFLMGKIGADINFGKHIGYIKITEFASSFEDSGARYYLYGRHWEKRFNEKLYLSFNEAAKTTNVKPNPLIFVLPFYLYQDIFRYDVDSDINNMMSIDLWYRFTPRFQGYVDWVVDDMQAPQYLHEGAAWNLPRKTGYLVGGYWPNLLGDGQTSFRAEYIQTDPGTYQATRPGVQGLTYTHDNFVIGHPVGSNSEAFYLRADHKFGSYWSGIAEYLSRQPKESDGPNPFDQSRLSLIATRDITPRGSVSLRYDSFKLPQKEDSLQLSANYSF